jgi:hypothetical protein
MPDNGLELETKFGKLKAQGASGMFIAALIVAFALGVYVLHQDHLAALSSIAAVNKSIDDVNDAIDLQNYMLRIPQEERTTVPVKPPKFLPQTK